MIKIVEAPTRKLPGLSSLFITFDYKAQIVDEIKLLETRIFDENHKDWEIPTGDLARILDALTNLDDIDLHLLDTQGSEQIEYDLLPFKTKPFKHQIEGIQYGLNKDRWLLLDDPGLGKTHQLINLAKELKEKRGLEHCFIICGLNTLKTNWKLEIEKHSDLSAMILGQRYTRKGKLRFDGIAKRLEHLKNPIEEFFVITNVESLRSDEIVKAILHGPNKFDMIVVDEIHTCFTYDTLISTNLGYLKIGDIVEYDIDCYAHSYNHDARCYEYKPIISKFKANSSKLIELVFEDDDKSYTLQCTPDHKIYTENRGYVCASELTSEDEILIENIVYPE